MKLRLWYAGAKLNGPFNWVVAQELSGDELYKRWYGLHVHINVPCETEERPDRKKNSPAKFCLVCEGKIRQEEQTIFIEPEE